MLNACVVLIRKLDQLYGFIISIVIGKFLSFQKAEDNQSFLCLG